MHNRAAHRPGPALEPGRFARVMDVLERCRKGGLLGEAAARWSSGGRRCAAAIMLGHTRKARVPDAVRPKRARMCLNSLRACVREVVAKPIRDRGERRHSSAPDV